MQYNHSVRDDGVDFYYILMNGHQFDEIASTAIYYCKRMRIERYNRWLLR